MVNLKVYDSLDEIADAEFMMLLEAVRTAGSAAGTALSFGSTYEPIFRRWKLLFERSVGSRQAHLPAFFPADERLVDIADSRSNWGSARNLFIDECGTKADIGRWASNAAAYRAMLTDFFGPEKTAGTVNPGLPVFDIIFLGLGPDGHTASLFPGSCPSEDDEEWNCRILETTAPFDPPGRLSLGPEVIARAAKLIVTVTGSGKAGIFARLYSEIKQKTEKALPPARIIKRREFLGLDTIILTDRAAAEKTEIKE